MEGGEGRGGERRGEEGEGMNDLVILIVQCSPSRVLHRP